MSLPPEGLRPLVFESQKDCSQGEELNEDLCQGQGTEPEGMPGPEFKRQLSYLPTHWVTPGKFILQTLSLLSCGMG